MFGEKNKALTFSYDDGVTQDIRLIEIFNKYGLRATFNLNSGLLGKPGSLLRDGATVSHDKNKAEDVRYIYDGHEVAAHTLTHPSLPRIKSDAEVIRQVEEDRLALSELVGYEVKGMAYPGGGENFDARVAKLIAENTPIEYARTVGVTHSFEPCLDFYGYKGTLYHHADFEMLFEMGRKFLEMPATTPQIFYIWGHAYEFDIYPERWQMFEEFCKMMSGKNDIFYGTNIEIVNKVKKP